MPRRRSRSRDRDDDDVVNDGNGDDDDIEFGIRGSRRSVSYHHRHSSANHPHRIMEQEVYYDFAAEILNHADHISQTVVLLVAIHHYYNAFADTIDQARQKLATIKKIIDRLCFLLSWISSYGELALLYAEDLTVFIRHRRPRWMPLRYQTINEINPEDCDAWFGLSPFDLCQLFVHWRVPSILRTPCRKTYQGEECFLIMMFHMNKGAPFTAMARNTFGGDPRRLSEMFDLMIDHLYLKFYHKISGTSLGMWIPRYLHTCRRLIYDAMSEGALKVTQYANGIPIDRQWILHHYDFSTFRPFGFLDDFAVPMARPGSWAQRIHDFQHDIQRAFYSGYLRRHGLKAQVVFLPIGMIGSVFITELRQNDNGVQNMSGLNNYLVELLAGTLLGGLLPCLYGDGIFRILATIIPRYVNPTEAEQFLNLRYASLRQCIEHVFGDHRNRFQIFSVPHRLHLFNRGEKIRRMTLVSFFILNCYYSINGTRSRYFGHMAPTLEEYIPLWEVLHPPPAVNLGPIWDYGPN